MTQMTYAEVIVRANVDKTLVYQVPEHLIDSVSVGVRVTVSLRHQVTEGVICRVFSSGELDEKNHYAIKPLRAVVPSPALPPDIVDLMLFLSRYYLVSPGRALSLILPTSHRVRMKTCVVLTTKGNEVIREKSDVEKWEQSSALSSLERELLQMVSQTNRPLVVPSLLKQWKGNETEHVLARSIDRLVTLGLLEKQVVEQTSKRRRTQEPEVEKKQAEQAEGNDPSKVVLTEEQEQAVSAIVSLMTRKQSEGHSSETQGSGAFLLHGVTGSGKTEVYMQAISHALKLDQTAIVLVPEIALTPQLAGRFQKRFGELVGVLHSGVSIADKRKVWEQLAKGEKKIALGARSALFAPLFNVGLIVVDEEHDASFKQQEDVWYHGRDLALVRGKFAKAVVVLGSATPSLESLALVESGKIQSLRLTKRVGAVLLPTVYVVDMKKHIASMEQGFLSAPLMVALKETLEKKEQAILFLNRRGYATMISCRACGYHFECTNCSVALVFHKETNQLLCHYCGFHTQIKDQCPSCHEYQVVRLGMGTQKIAERLIEQFPDARVARLDRDTATPVGLSDIITRMQLREIDILIGTQMLAKGHDFPLVTLVGVIFADLGMHVPDFRAAERTFQVLTQVAGRAGRAERKGRVYIQTFLPEHPAIRCACVQDTLQFAKGETVIRKEKFYPPYSRMAAIRLDGVDEFLVKQTALQVSTMLRDKMSRIPSGIMVKMLGPAPAPLSRLKGHIRYQLFLQASHTQWLHQLLYEIETEKSQYSKEVRVHIDVDPISML